MHNDNYLVLVVMQLKNNIILIPWPVALCLKNILLLTINAILSHFKNGHLWIDINSEFSRKCCCLRHILFLINFIF